nr:molybdopterin biosynthesis protein [Cavernulicola chilensis]
MLHSKLHNFKFNEEDSIRYSRHLLLPQVGLQGQRKLKSAKVLCIGAGGLGSIILMYLAASGIGTIGIVDNDNVDLSNLQRQIIHSSKFLNKPKTNSAYNTLMSLNHNCYIIQHQIKLRPDNVIDILYAYDIIIDGTDNFETKYLINDACILLNKPNVYGAIFQFQGQASVFNYRGGPNYRDIYPSVPLQNQAFSCEETGVLGILPGTIGLVQATETIKIILGIGKILSKRVLLYDALKTSYSTLQIDSQTNINRKYFDSFYEDSISIPFQDCNITVDKLKRLMLSESKYLVIVDVRTKQEYCLDHIQNSISLPLNQLDNSQTIKWIYSQSQKKKVVVHCKTGQRSARALQLLNGYGVRAYQLSGGIIAWHKDNSKPLLNKQ